uniref:SNF2 N-terminal domain-containing protein n=1 Tax=Cladonia uncialis subsp. uncialis TaxID=180999 RepID=A0A2K9YDT4_CLAUC|nr:hypothetical protein [Cladonia uncialis subsp. uncialis]
MSSVAPQIDFNYDAPPKNNAWTRQHLFKAYPASHQAIVEELFTAASNLTLEHNIFPGKYSRTELQSLRKQHSQTLISTFRNRLAIEGHPTFIEHMCLGVLTYSATLVRHKGSAGPATKAENSIREENERPATIKQESTRNLLIHPPEKWPNWKLEDFEFNRCPYRYSASRIGQKVRAGSIGEWRKDADLQLKDLRLSTLQEELENFGLISDASQAEFTYNAENGRIIGIKSNNDLQLAMPTSLKFSAGLPTTGPLMPLGSFLPGRPSTHHRTLSIRSKNNRPASEPGPSTRKHPTPSAAESSSDSDELLRSLDQRNSRLAYRSKKSRKIVKDKGLHNTSLPGFESDKEVGSGDIMDVNADAFTEEKNLESQFRRSADTQLCERLEDRIWERAAKIFRIPRYENTTSKDKHKIPGTLKPLCHWQWLCVFISIIFNARTYGYFGALISDEMGLGKIWEALAFVVIHQQLWQQWQAIYKKWLLQVYNNGIVKRTRPTIFFVPTSNVLMWLAELRDLVDFSMLGINLVVAHASITQSDPLLTPQIKSKILTVRDLNDPEP